MWQGLFADESPPDLLIREMEEDGYFVFARKWADRDMRFQKMTTAQVDRCGDHFDPDQVGQHTGDEKKQVINDLKEHHAAVCLMCTTWLLFINEAWRK